LRKIAGLMLYRTLMAGITLLIVSAAIFFAVEFSPGDIATHVLGRSATETAKQALRERLHLDRPAYERYLIWLGDLAHGDLGESLLSGRDVRDIMAAPLKLTLFLGCYAVVLYVPLSLLLATLSAVFKGRTPDLVISVLTLVGLSLPEFVLGDFLIILFAVAIPIFSVITLADRATTLGGFLQIGTLPAITLAVVMIVYAVRMLRDNLIEVLNSEYVRMATLRGLPRYRVVLRHALPNALGPTLNVTAINLAYLIGGVVIVEQVFSYPGLGSLLVQSIYGRDAPVIEAITLLTSAVYIFATLFADLMQILLNPRLRTA
jgi:peptide/nickel transport system permease protein